MREKITGGKSYLRAKKLVAILQIDTYAPVGTCLGAGALMRQLYHLSRGDGAKTTQKEAKHNELIDEPID